MGQGRLHWYNWEPCLSQRASRQQRGWAYHPRQNCARPHWFHLPSCNQAAHPCMVARARAALQSHHLLASEERAATLGSWEWPPAELLQDDSNGREGWLCRLRLVLTGMTLLGLYCAFISSRSQKKEEAEAMRRVESRPMRQNSRHFSTPLRYLSCTYDSVRQLVTLLRHPRAQLRSCCVKTSHRRQTVVIRGRRSS